jgi:hypothetical protein
LHERVHYSSGSPLAEIEVITELPLAAPDTLLLLDEIQAFRDSPGGSRPCGTVITATGPDWAENE